MQSKKDYIEKGLNSENKEKWIQNVKYQSSYDARQCHLMT
jgi:hypothetical protein